MSLIFSQHVQLTDCGLLAKYSVSVQLESKAFTGFYEKFKLISVVNDFIDNLQVNSRHRWL